MIQIPTQYRNAFKKYKFIDLFCGIGGFHLALTSFGAECVFASEIDKEAQKIYSSNFKLSPKGDITKIENGEIPIHDILCAGFPCQAFSISGAQAGFDDEKTGQLFFEIIRIAKHHKPRMILLENVANLNSHNNGKTIVSITESLENIGYRVHKQIMDSSDYNVPQCRRRLYIVAFRDDIKTSHFTFPNKLTRQRNLDSVLENSNSDHIKNYIIDRTYNLRPEYQTWEDNCKKPYIRIGEIGLGRQGERIYSQKGCATTLSSSGGGLGGRTGIYLINDTIRKLTPRECARLMGFPDWIKIASTANSAYKQFGNSVVIDVLQLIIIEIIKSFEEASHE